MEAPFADGGFVGVLDLDLSFAAIMKHGARWWHRVQTEGRAGTKGWDQRWEGECGEEGSEASGARREMKTNGASRKG